MSIPLFNEVKRFLPKQCQKNARKIMHKRADSHANSMLEKCCVLVKHTVRTPSLLSAHVRGGVEENRMRHDPAQRALALGTRTNERTRRKRLAHDTGARKMNKPGNQHMGGKIPVTGQPIPEFL